MATPASFNIRCMVSHFSPSGHSSLHCLQVVRCPSPCIVHQQSGVFLMTIVHLQWGAILSLVSSPSQLCCPPVFRCPSQVRRLSVFRCLSQILCPSTVRLTFEWVVHRQSVVSLNSIASNYPAVFIRGIADKSPCGSLRVFLSSVVHKCTGVSLRCII